MISVLPETSATTPLMFSFSASVHYRFAMSPAELHSAGLDWYAAT